MKYLVNLSIILLFSICFLLPTTYGNKYSKKANEDFGRKDDYKKKEYDKKKEYKNDYDRGRDYNKKDYDKDSYKKDYDVKKQENEVKKEYDPRYNEYKKDRQRENDYAWQEKKTSLDATQFVDDPNFDMRRINKPFRVAKLNLLWTKAQSRLTEPKLKSIFSELKMHDKEELTWKRLKAEGKDTDGLLEADLRRKLSNIMNTYGLLEHFEEVHDAKKFKNHEPMSGPVENYLNRGLFNDKKLNKLWEKAEHSGFSAEELQILREEFNHHQDKVNEYYTILNDVGETSKDTAINSVDEKLDRFNELHQVEEDPISQDYLSKVNALRDKHKEIRDDYDRLYRMAMSGPKSQEFTEPRVQGLWKIALKGNFTPDELESLKVELFHYEKRLLKLRRLHVEAVMEEEQRKLRGIEKPAELDLTDDLIKKQSRKVAKMHLDIETRILERHTEL